ncbi:CCR4-Not complex component [Pleurostoma richardsiae]|uniref:General negative regulator of transcription subunit 1 n=1 Tax=Pleurostoma richardsiae TaxID=41990 RepID=A0AA38RKH8_9PEZI|nr:CCR4-Not complex component [Pleurostoma richardsiae]
MVPRSSGTFSPNPTQGLQTGASHSPHPSQAGVLSAGASPSTSSPTGTSSLSKITIAQVYLLLSSFKEKKDDPAELENKVNRLNKLIDDGGMEVFTKYFARLVSGNAAQVFPGLNRPGSNATNSGSYPLLVSEMRKVSHDINQATKIAEAIETGTEDIFRDFDLSTFMEHFKLDALEKTILALAFKLGNRSDLKTKADAILSTNFPTFITIASRPEGEHADLDSKFLSIIIDRLIQHHPPNFNAASKNELSFKIESRYTQMDQAPPSEVLAALDLMRVLGEKPPNALALYIQRIGPEFTRDEETCVSYLQNRPSNIQLSEEQASNALTYATISQSPSYNPAVLVAGLRRVLPPTFRWQDVVSYFDQRGARISSPQFLRLYNALRPIAEQNNGSTFDIQHLWGGNWENPETQLSFICAFASLTPDQLDASTIPGLQATFSLDAYSQSPPAVRERAAVAVKHPLVSVVALSAVFHVALHSVHASQTTEAKRLFQEVVVPNLDIFVVSAFGVPKPWPQMAVDTLNSLFENFLYKRSPEYDFVLDSLWRKDKDWVKQRLIDAHAVKPIDLPLIFEHALKHSWLDELVYLNNGFGLDLTALAHAEGQLDLDQWATTNTPRSAEIARSLLQFLMIKANLEIQFQRPPDGQPPVKTSMTLQVKTVSHLLAILEEFLPKTPVPELIVVQRHCITAYPRLINYGEGYDDIIDANGLNGNALPPAANTRMEEHYKKMYSDEIQVRNIVEILERYKHSRDPLDQDVFACMIHGLFDEYTHYVDYPLEALATTAVLFGGIISHKLISDLPLQIGLGMILEAVRDHLPEDSMYKFGLQALMQLFARFPEWPGFCEQLLQIPGLQGTDAWKKAEEVVRTHEEEIARTRNGNGLGHGAIGNEALTNGTTGDDALASEQHYPPFASINVDPLPPGTVYEDPTSDTQGRIQFVLNNLTETTLQGMFRELREMLQEEHRQWFASHLVEERAKMQPNYHHVYLDLVKQFEDRALWAGILRETYVSVSRMLNSEVTMQNSTERAHLKNLGGWLGLLTLARDKPIKHRNIAFKQLLMEAHDTKRLIVVIPFVCKVLIQGASSKVFRPPNPWLMDIVQLLIELYHNGELKLNLKFEIEVLCKGLNLDHKSIEPSGEILNRVPAEEPVDLTTTDALESFENLSLNGIGSGVPAGLSPHAIAPSIPDLGPSLQIPPTNEMIVSSARLHEIVRTALTRALQDIIQPVVDRSVTIAAISTQQMIHKDFATEPDENRVRASAINMVKATAGSLALVTSKEPLRANFTNYMRNLSNDLPQGLPEGTIIMCVNSNLDLASSVIEKSAEERAVPEIEEMIEPELEARRRHRLQRPNEPYVDSSLSRWAWTIPNPYKLSPSLTGLNPEQMAIYEDFARQARTGAPTTTASHVSSTSDATRNMANDVLQDQYPAVPSLPTPAETPSMPHLGAQMQTYPQAHAGLTNGRQAGAPQVDLRALAERVQKLLFELQRAAAEAREEHFLDLPRPHQVIDTMDSLIQTIIKAQSSEDFVNFATEQICGFLFSGLEDSLALESLVHVLDSVRKIGGPTANSHVRAIFQQQEGQRFLRLPLIAALLTTDLLDWRVIDEALAKTLVQRDDKGIQLLADVIHMTVITENPLALLADFAHSLEVAFSWIREDPHVSGAELLQSRMQEVFSQPPTTQGTEDGHLLRQEQMDYVFDEWVQLCRHSHATEGFTLIFVKQLQTGRIINNKEELFVFIRLALDKSVVLFEQVTAAGGSLSDGYIPVDALAKFIATVTKIQSGDEAEGQSNKAAFLNSIFALGVMVLSNHHLKRAELFNQRVFYRFFSVILHEIDAMSELITDFDRNQIFIKFAARLCDIGPPTFPGFAYAWMSLLEHRAFLPAMMKMEGDAGWAPYTKLLTQLLEFIGEQLKAFEVSPLAKDLYRATVKLLIVLQHDFPEYLSANHIQLIESIPPYCTQLVNMVLVANPASGAKMPNPLQPGLRVDRLEELLTPPHSSEDPASFLQQLGLLDILKQALEAGPSENAVAHMTHAINKPSKQRTAFGHVPLAANLEVIDAIVAYIGAYAVEKTTEKGGNVFVPGATDIATLSMLVHELPPEARYYFLNSVVNQLRSANSHTQFFSQALLEIFVHDLADPEETEIRQQITRILLERLVGFWPQPWGLMITAIELIKNEKYMFFDLPFINSAPEVAQRFMEVLQRA